MSLPSAIREAIEREVGAVRSARALGGGCIGHATRIETARGVFFLKWGTGDAGRTFRSEVDGLEMLHAALHSAAPADLPLVVPRSIGVRDAVDSELGWLLLPWIEEGDATPRFWERLGGGLADLHSVEGADAYGLGQANWIGATPQFNAWHEAWPWFFRTQRIAPQVARARASGRWREAWSAPLEGLLDWLPAILPAHPHPAPLHGDLWRGNVLATTTGRPALIDPAVYYGHRETDLALTELFGGFDARFYDAYRSAWPLEPGYAERRTVYNLYHLLNHLNLFGEAYAARVAQVLRRY